ncbi:MAG: SDR family NAD(P)-dependent oxidoreductase, partial [Chloroflexota bacterium]
SAEINALRYTFGDHANRIIIANTKGYTGHSMGVGVEDVVAVKALQYGQVPPIANYDTAFEPDPELGDLNLSKGGEYPVKYALRLGAGFGSQIAMALFRVVAGVKERVNQPVYQRWLADLAGYEQAEIEVEKRTLRIHHAGPPVKPPVKSRWEYGQGPTRWADQPEETPTVQPQPQTLPESIPQPAPVAAEKSASQPVAVHPLVAGVEPVGIKQFVLNLVSEKTGYPVEMLDLELDLEADLGIDTVKQAEIFAAIRSHYSIPRREDLRLSDYNTLTKVIGFMQENQGGNALPTPPVPAPAAAQSPAQPAAAVAETITAPLPQAGIDRPAIEAHVLAVVSEKTGYPVEMLDLGLDLEADLGIDTVKQAELFAAVRTHYGIPRREDLRLVDYNTLDKVIGFIMDALSAGQGSQHKEAPAAAPFMTVSQPKAQPAPAQISQPEARPEPAAISSGSQAAHSEDIKAYVLGVVSEKTGYPVEMLDLDLDLEADLGIDTVKQAELFATIRTHYNIPRREDLRLVDYNTLTKVIGFMEEALSGKPQAQPVVVQPATVEQSAPVMQESEPVATPATQAVQSADPVEAAPAAQAESRESAVSEPVVTIRRRVPMPVLRPRLDLCLPTGVNLQEGSRVVIIADQGKAADSLARRLRARKAQVLNVIQAAPGAMIEKVKSFQDEGEVQGVYYLPGLDAETPLPQMQSADWDVLIEERLMRLYHLFRILDRDPFLICATRMGGLHGYSHKPAASALAGAISGFAKALSRERPKSFVKVIDFVTDLPDHQLAARLVDETLRDPGAVEIGWENDQRFTITLVEKSHVPVEGLPIENPVVMITGGAGGIVAPVLVDLSHRVRGSYYLLGRSPLADPNDADIQRLNQDRDGLKKVLLQRMAAQGQKPSPAQIEEKLAALERMSGVLGAMEQARANGARVEYLVCDVTNPLAIHAAVQHVLALHDHVDVVIHAAGVERSRKLTLKTEDEFRTTLSVKATGLFNLYKELQQRGKLPAHMILFGSVAGRFGNSGQTDYSAANDLIAKMSSNLKIHHPQMRMVTIDWSAWAQVGMASRGYIPQLMEMGGIDQMPPHLAAGLVYAELAASDSHSEVILSGSLGSLELPSRADGGLDIEAANRALVAGEPPHVMLSRVTGLDPRYGVLLEAELNPDEEPFLKDHALNGIPLLPGVMGIEGFSVAARHVASVLGSDKAGFMVERLEDIHFLAAFKFYHNEPRRITWKAQVVREVTGLVAYVTLESVLALKTRQNERVQHFSGKVHLSPAPEPIQKVTVEPPLWNGAYTVTGDDIYRLYFHGPSFQVLEAVQRNGETVLGRMRPSLPEITGRDMPLVTTPILLELCLQTAGVWEAGATGALALPRSIGRLNLFREKPNGGVIYAEVMPASQEDGSLRFDARVVDEKGNLYLEVRDYRTVPLPYSVDTALLKPMRLLVRGNDSGY